MCMNVHVYVSAYTYIHTYTHTHIHTHTHTYIHTYIHTYTHTYIHSLHTYNILILYGQHPFILSLRLLVLIMSLIHDQFTTHTVLCFPIRYFANELGLLSHRTRYISKYITFGREVSFPLRLVAGRRSGLEDVTIDRPSALVPSDQSALEKKKPATNKSSCQETSVGFFSVRLHRGTGSEFPTPRMRAKRDRNRVGVPGVWVH